MATIIAQNSKYLILILFIAYLAGCFIQKKTTDIMQKILIYVIHFFGFLCLLLKSVDVQLIGFYLLQLILISAIMIGFQLVYKGGSALLTNHICMCFVISMIVLTRISFGEAFRQFLFWVVGFCGMMLIPVVMQKVEVFRKYPAIYAIVGVLLLGLVVVVGAKSYGAKLHLNIGPITFQPSEFVKLVFIMFIAAMLFKEASTKRVLLTSAISAIFVLCLVASRDLGGALLYFTTYLMMIYVATRKKLCLGLGSLGICVAAVAGYFLFSHVQTRVFAWLTPLADFDKKGYQMCQSLFGIGTGGWFGFGIGEGKPTLIPIVEKDFIFSAISEEFGAFFGIGLILLTLSIFWEMISIGQKCDDRFCKYSCVGLAVVYAAQVILTIGGAIKFIPSTGVTLPLISLGGSSLLASLMMFGVVQGIQWKKNILTASKEGRIQKEDVEKEKTISLVSTIFTVIFATMVLYFVYFMIFESPIYIYSEYNKLMS